MYFFLIEQIVLCLKNVKYVHVPKTDINKIILITRVLILKENSTTIDFCELKNESLHLG